MSQLEQRRIAELQARIVSLESEVEHWRNQALRGNVIPMPRVRPLEPVSATSEDARAISKLNIPTFDPNRNLILDPIEPRRGEPE